MRIEGKLQPTAILKGFDMKYYNSFMHMLNGFGLWEWVLIGVAVLAIGLFCMRGFGSRSNY